MKHNIFQKEIPLAILFSFLESVCTFHELYYLFDKNVYLKMKQEDSTSFLESLQPYYLHSKRGYLEKNDFNGIVTIIRQICNYWKHPYRILKKNNLSKYTLCYFIERP
jgi:hypothetical protein